MATVALSAQEEYAASRLSYTFDCQFLAAVLTNTNPCANVAVLRCAFCWVCEASC